MPVEIASASPGVNRAVSSKWPGFASFGPLSMKTDATGGPWSDYFRPSLPTDA